MALVVWKYYTMDNGEQFVMIIGIQMMLRLYVVNLDIKMLLELFKEVRFLVVPDRYG
jgi:hypothetical protein